MFINDGDFSMESVMEVRGQLLSPLTIGTICTLTEFAT